MVPEWGFSADSAKGQKFVRIRLKIKISLFIAEIPIIPSTNESKSLFSTDWEE
jgi:hypothetical protein